MEADDSAVNGMEELVNMCAHLEKGNIWELCLIYTEEEWKKEDS